MAIKPRTMWASLSPWRGEGGRLARRAGAGLARQPNLAGAAAHLVGIRTQVVGQWRQRSAELDHVAVAVLPDIEEGKIRTDGIDRHSGARTLTPALRLDRARAIAVVPLCIWSRAAAAQASVPRGQRRR